MWGLYLLNCGPSIENAQTDHAGLITRKEKKKKKSILKLRNCKLYLNNFVCKKETTF